MDALHRAAIAAFMAARISVEELVARLGVDPQRDPRYVQSALAERSASDVEHAMMLTFRFGLSRAWAAALARLLNEDWHESHEDIANALQDLRDPATEAAILITFDGDLHILAAKLSKGLMIPDFKIAPHEYPPHISKARQKRLAGRFGLIGTV